MKSHREERAVGAKCQVPSAKMGMGLVERFEWVNGYSKRRCRSLFWRVRAALKKALKNRGKQRLKFQYDPSSYALNFDDTSSAANKDARLLDLTHINNNTFVYVLFLQTT
ncbi:hypothetical protein VNO78_03751 [Psophocarpus tetragonolobus]|uniref:Uncharacterized protein n=1 Tax=Psophocarpus tetragonolobus TaxID=3891 RepID=A0AAN9T212_PSOTE